MRFVASTGVSLLLGAVFGLVGCGPLLIGRIYLESDAGEDAGGDAGAGGAASIPADGGCEGTCLSAPEGWDGPFASWWGNARQAPACPNGVSNRWYAGLVVPTTCEGCACEASIGMCALPSKLTASTKPCGGGGKPIPFDAPPGWDGTCDKTNPIDAAAGAQSLSIDPLVVSQEACAVSATSGPPKPAETHWETEAVACLSDHWSWCSAPDTICVPPVKPPFRVCVLHDGDRPCDGHTGFTEKVGVFYDGVDDQRQCTACGCGSPKGSMCVAQVSVYQSDMTCNGPMTVSNLGVSSQKPTCTDINPSGQPLGSKVATSPTYIAGTCDPIPSVVDPDAGTATPQWPITICCQP